jgi:hypothetical protein
MATLTKKEILKRGFKEIWEGGYKQEGVCEEYKYRVVIYSYTLKQSRPRLFNIEISKFPTIPFDNKNPNSWSFELRTIIETEEDLNNLLKFAKL